MLDLKRHQHNAQDGTLRLEPGSTKNREGRVVRVTVELCAMLNAQVDSIRELERSLFPHLDGAGPRSGTWNRPACRALWR